MRIDVLFMLSFVAFAAIAVVGTYIAEVKEKLKREKDKNRRLRRENELLSRELRFIRNEEEVQKAYADWDEEDEKMYSVIPNTTN